MIRIASHVLVAGTAGQIKRVCRRYTIARWCVAYLRACPFLPEPYTSRQVGWLSLSDAYGIIPGRKNSVICVIRAENMSIPPKLQGNLKKNEGRGADIRFFFLFLWSYLTLWKNLKPKLFIINNKNY